MCLENVLTHNMKSHFKMPMGNGREIDIFHKEFEDRVELVN